MEENYQVHPYSIDTLKDILAERASVNKATIAVKFHFCYFETYFSHFGAKTIVVENEYIDRDYLEDFTGYYVRCFKDYERKCSRLHFFTVPFSPEDFKSLLSGTVGRLAKDQIQSEDSYLGFIIGKPLPQTLIGRTCLKTYPSDGRRRDFPVVRDCEANLFGLRLHVKTLPYQEQDRVVAACATSALWTAFQGTGKLFQHQIPSPVEITRMAGKAGVIHPRLISRVLPNHGLTTNQMAHAITSIGLEPDLVGADNTYLLRSTAYAYLRGKIPILFLFFLFSTPQGTCIGKHAVTVTGFSLGKNVPDSGPRNGFLLKACRIDKLYVHDDQIGPFARMELDGITVDQDDGSGNIFRRETVSTSWPDETGKIGNVRAIPDVLLTPLYHKVRIPFSIIHDSILDLDELLEELRGEGILRFQGRLEWDIFLSTVNDFKEDILGHPTLVGVNRLSVLSRSMPHYIWRARAEHNGTEVAEFLFDATDIEQGAILEHAIVYDDHLMIVLKAVSRAPWIKAKYQGKAIWQILRWFTQPST